MKQFSHFILYGNCILVKGYKESIICDLEKHVFLSITNNIYDVLKTNEDNKFSINDLKRYYNNCIDQGIDKLFDYIKNQGYGFFTNEPDLFPKVSLVWDSPYRLTNSIIEITSESMHISRNVINQLSKNGCQAIELRFIDTLSIYELEDFLKLFDNNMISCVILYLKYSKEFTFENVIKIYYEHSKIGQLIIHSSPKECDFNNLVPSQLKTRIRQTSKVITGNAKDIFNNNSFVINIQSFTESYNFNLGLNRKVCVDAKGNIKNHISHDKYFGNVITDKIDSILIDENFTKVWLINKDKIEVCKECQYRYICMDNEEIEYNYGSYVRKSTCNYDPYNNSWKN